MENKPPRDCSRLVESGGCLQEQEAASSPSLCSSPLHPHRLGRESHRPLLGKELQPQNLSGVLVETQSQTTFLPTLSLLSQHLSGSPKLLQTTRAASTPLEDSQLGVCVGTMLPQLQLIGRGAKLGVGGGDPTNGDGTS